MAITREQIWQVADELDAAGQNPTLAAVRKAVGGGSYTTIQEAMTEWKAKKAAKDAPRREPVPQAVTDRLGELGAELWAVASELANARLAAEREALELARADIEAARQEAADLADQLTSELDEAKGRIAALTGSEQAARAELDELRQRLTVAEAKGEAIEREATALRQENEQAKRAAAEARERAATLAGKLEAMEAQNAALLAQLSPKESAKRGK